MMGRGATGDWVHGFVFVWARVGLCELLFTQCLFTADAQVITECKFILPTAWFNYRRIN